MFALGEMFVFVALIWWDTSMSGRRALDWSTQRTKSEPSAILETINALGETTLMPSRGHLELCRYLKTPKIRAIGFGNGRRLAPGRPRWWSIISTRSGINTCA
jgi:hypothetical protein